MTTDTRSMDERLDETGFLLKEAEKAALQWLNCERHSKGLGAVSSLPDCDDSNGKKNVALSMLRATSILELRRTQSEGAAIAALIAANAEDAGITGDVDALRLASFLQFNHASLPQHAQSGVVEEIRAAFETVTMKDGVRCSDHALHNLEGAIIDIERQGKADAVSLRTLHRVAEQLARIEQALATPSNRAPVAESELREAANVYAAALDRHSMEIDRAIIEDGDPEKFVTTERGWTVLRDQLREAADVLRVISRLATVPSMQTDASPQPDRESERAYRLVDFSRALRKAVGTNKGCGDLTCALESNVTNCSCYRTHKFYMTHVEAELKELTTSTRPQPQEGE